MSNSDFPSDLDQSQRASAELPWSEIFREAYPGVIESYPLSKDGLSQRKGIDRGVRLDDGSLALIEEKIRVSDYEDITLEVGHAYPGRSWQFPPRLVGLFPPIQGYGFKDGWMLKEEHCDMLAYVRSKAKICYLIPWPQLVVAWEKYGHDWWNNYKIPPARNPRNSRKRVIYWTYNVAIPPKVLKAAVPGMITVEYGSMKCPEQNSTW